MAQSSRSPAAQSVKKTTEHVLTDRQEKILAAICNITASRGYPPSIREIGDCVGLSSSSSVAHQLKTLEENGYLIRNAGRPRAVNFAKKASDFNPLTELENLPPSQHQYLPMLGTIAAGTPISAEAFSDEQVAVPEELLGAGTHFLLTVKGNSMIEAAICDGDWVIIKKQNTAVNGQIVAAMIDQDVTVKSFHKSKNGVWLIPQNSSYSPINGNNAAILGVVCGLMRKM